MAAYLSRSDRSDEKRRQDARATIVFTVDKRFQLSSGLRRSLSCPIRKANHRHSPAQSRFCPKGEWRSDPSRSRKPKTHHSQRSLNMESNATEAKLCTSVLLFLA